MTMRIRRINVNDLLNFSVLLLIVLICLPITQCLPEIVRKAFQAVSMGTFIIGMIIKRDGHILFRYILLVAFFGTYVIMVWEYRQSFFTCLFNVLSIVEICCFGLYIVEKKIDISALEKLLKIVLILMTVTSITTIVGLVQFPLAVRELGRSVGYASSYGNFEALKWTYRLHNIAGWSQLYGLVFYAPVALSLYRIKKDKLYLVSAVLCEICIIMGQITFALLLSIVLLFLMMYRPPKTANQFIVWALVLAAIVLIILNFRHILEFAIEFFGNCGLDMLTIKLRNLYQLTNKSLSGDALDRFVLYQKSIAVFKNYPILGFILSGNRIEDVFCYHSEFFDMLGFYGFFGIIVSTVIISRYLYWLRTQIIDRWPFYILLVGLLSLYIFNPIWYSPQIFLGGLLIPAIIDRMKDNRQMGGI